MKELNAHTLQDIKQAAKMLVDFIESCPGGESYITTPNNVDLKTDWGYVVEGLRLIHDWAEVHYLLYDLEEGDQIDLISRQSVLDAINSVAELLRRAVDNTDIINPDHGRYGWGSRLIKSLALDIAKLPPAQLERKKGKWAPRISTIFGTESTTLLACNQCGYSIIRGTESNFCPCCGADMREEETDNND